MQQQDRAAVGGTFVTWTAWFGSHIGQINEWVQFFLLLAGLVSAYYTIRYYRKRHTILDHDYTDTGAWRFPPRNDK